MRRMPKVVALAGGVGGAKLADGLRQVLPPEHLAVIVNTGDDFEHFGLRICPDLDTVCYTLAGIANLETGWGRAGETWSAIAFSTPVKDTDKDGIVDRLETAPSGNISSFKDPNGSAYPRLWSMGASVGPRDLFVEINSFEAQANTSYGSAAHPFPLPGQDLDHDGVVIDTMGHDHRPLPTTLTRITWVEPRVTRPVMFFALSSRP